MNVASSHQEMIPSDAGSFTRFPNMQMCGLNALPPFNVMGRPNGDAGALDAMSSLGMFTAFFAGLAVGVFFFGSSARRAWR